MALSEQQKTRISVDIYGQNYKMVGSETIWPYETCCLHGG